jgi:hypothetical protein
MLGSQVRPENCQRKSFLPPIRTNKVHLKLKKKHEQNAKPYRGVFQQRRDCKNNIASTKLEEI